MLKLASTLPGALSPLVLTPHPRILLCLSTPSSMHKPTPRSGCLPRLPGPYCQLHQPPGVCTWPSLPVPAHSRSSTLRPWPLERSPLQYPPLLQPLAPCLSILSFPSAATPTPSLDPELEPVELPFLCVLGNQNQAGCPPLLHMSMCVSGCAHVSLCARVSVCMCVSVHICMCQCMHACVHVSLCACVCQCVYVCVSACMRVHMCLCVHVSVCACVCMCMCQCMHVCAHVSVCTCLCVHVCVCVCVRACMCVHMCLCVHACQCVHVHTYPYVNAACLCCVHTYTQDHACMCVYVQFHACRAFSGRNVLLFLTCCSAW